MPASSKSRGFRVTTDSGMGAEIGTRVARAARVG